MKVVAASILAGALFSPADAAAQQLSTRRYDVPDGLAHGLVAAIHQDRQGYLWFATHEGLSRFDGYQFTNYGVRDGLGSFIVNTVQEDRRGRIWVGTNGGGVARLQNDPAARSADAKGQQTFVAFRVGESGDANQVNRILFDAEGSLWCVTDAGLYRSVGSIDEPTFRRVLPGVTPLFRQAAYEDAKGRLWFGLREQLVEYDHGAMSRHVPRTHEPRPHEIVQVLEDDRGRLLAVDSYGVYELIESSGEAPRWRPLPIRMTPAQTLICAAVHAGALWIGSSMGVIAVADDRQSRYTTEEGLSDNFIGAISEDRDGNLWIGTGSRGVSRLAGASPLVTTGKEGLPAANVRAIAVSRDGRLYAVLENGAAVEIVDGRATPVPSSDPSRVVTQVVQDRQGRWWVGTDAGLYRFEGPALQLTRGRRVTAADGLPPGPIGQMVVDTAGRLWVTVADGASGRYSLHRLDPSQPPPARFYQATTDPLPNLRSIRTDRAGTLWFVGFGYLARLDGGRLVPFQSGDGLPGNENRALLFDSRGWLWLGLRYHGLSVTQHPSDAHPAWTSYTTETGLASDTVWDLVEGDDGRIYVATGRGLDQFDPATGRIRHVTSEYVYSCTKDRQGHIWTAGLGSLSKIDPRRLTDAAAPPAYVTRVRSAGESLTLPETGAVHIPFRTLTSNSSLSIDFVALSFQRENALTYQYRLQPVDRDWSAPTTLRSVNYARLAPGSYQFLVRATNQEGVVSPEPATFAFRVLAPVWQRWWFVALALTGLGWHRARLRRVVAMERIRRQLATDLHDDVGSGLVQVAILSEVAKRGASPGGEKLMDEVAHLARTMRGSMADIIWAVDPRHDNLTDLVARMKQVAYNLIEANGLRVDWHLLDAAELARINLAPDVRRHLLLIFTESLTNIARHARATVVRVDVLSRGRNLQLTVNDNGCGFDPGAPADGHGHGLYSLRERAAEIGARLSIDSRPGEGTAVTLILPLK